MIPASPGSNALSIGGFTIYWYGIFIALALALGLYIATRIGRRYAISPKVIIDIAFWVLLWSFVGARLYHVWNEWWWYHDHLGQIVTFWNGGFALHGGILAGVIAFFFFAKRKKIPLFALLDVAAIAFLVAQIIGRPGNYFNEELFGKPTDLSWGLVISPANKPDQFVSSETFHPLFLYEMICNALLLSLLFLLYKKTVRAGIIAGTYLIGYGIIRLSLDFLRIDQFGFGSLTLAQWVSIIFFISGVVLLFRLKNLTPKYP